MYFMFYLIIKLYILLYFVYFIYAQYIKDIRIKLMLNEMTMCIFFCFGKNIRFFVYKMNNMGRSILPRTTENLVGC